MKGNDVSMRSHLRRSLTLLVVAVPFALAACGTGQPEAAPTPTEERAPTITVDTTEQAGAVYWELFDRDDQDTFCEVLLGDDPELLDYLTERLNSGDYTAQEIDAIYAHATPICEDRAESASDTGLDDQPTTDHTEKETTTVFGPGTYLVPEELTPGTYRATTDVDGCLINHTETDSGDPVDYEYASSGRPTFTVKDVPGSQIDVSQGCGEWTRLER